MPARRPRSSTAALPVSVPASVLVPRGGAAARGCQARRHDVEDNVISGCQAPPVKAPAARRRAAFMRRDAVCLHFPAPAPRPPAFGKPRRAAPGEAFREEGVNILFEADGGMSTVPEALRVARTARSSVSGEYWAANSKFESRNSQGVVRRHSKFLIPNS
jgi:hypothetical protein